MLHENILRYTGDARKALIALHQNDAMTETELARSLKIPMPEMRQYVLPRLQETGAVREIGGKLICVFSSGARVCTDPTAHLSARKRLILEILKSGKICTLRTIAATIGVKSDMARRSLYSLRREGLAMSVSRKAGPSVWYAVNYSRLK